MATIRATALPTALLTALATLLALATGVQPAAAQQQRRAPLPSPGNPQAVEIVATLWCDTADQLETVVKSHYSDKVPMHAAMAAINKSSPEACVVARAVVTMGSEVRRLTAGDNVISLHSANVVGLMRGHTALMMRPQTWYGMRVVAELTPL